MTYLEALDILGVYAHPHLWRYRELTADDYHDQTTRDAWRAQVVVMAGGEPEIVVPVVEPLAPVPVRSVRLPALSPPDPWLVLIRSCDHHNPGCCSHPAPFCSRYNRDTNRELCIECLKADDIFPPEEFSHGQNPQGPE